MKYFFIICLCIISSYLIASTFNSNVEIQKISQVVKVDE